VVTSDLALARPQIPRPALAGRLREALDRGGLLLVAEAGFGKTTALEEALSGFPRAAWVRCQDADQDARRLLTSVMEAVRGMAPGAVDVLAERLAGPAQLDVPAATRDLVADMRRLLVDRVVIVIDDAERLAEAPAALDLVGELLAGAGDSYGVAIGTRHVLPLKVAKLRTGGKLVEVGAAELTFSSAECAELMRAQTQREPSEREVQGVMEATEGWPLGIVLSAARGPDQLPASRKALFDFLEEEVLERVPAALSERLLASSLLPELEPKMLEAVGLGGGLVEEVRTTGLQLRPSDAGEGAFSYQPLVREFLLSRLDSVWPGDRRQELHARVAAAMAAEGRGFEAVEHWLAAERWDDAVAAMAGEGPDLPRTAPEAVARWLSTLPVETRAAPTCLLLEGQLEWALGRHDRAVELLHAAVDGFQAGGDAAFEWTARFALCDPLGMVGRFDEMAELAEGFDSRGLEAGLPAAATAFYVAIGLGCLGRIEEMEEMARRLLAHPAGGMFQSLRVAWEQFSLTPQGRFDELQRGTDDAIAEFERADPFNRLPQQMLVHSLILMDQGRDEEALAAWSRTEKVADRAHMTYLVGLARATRARVHLRAGRIDEAEAELARAGAAPGGWEAYSWELARGGVEVLRGRAGDAAASVERAVTLAASATVLERIRIAIDAVPVLFEAGMPRRAMSLAEEGLELVDDHYPGAAGRYMHSLLWGLRAWMLFNAGETQAGVAELQRTWAEAGSNAAELVRREGVLLRPLLWTAVELAALDVDELVRAYEQAWPGGGALFEFTGHPLPEMRRAAAASIAMSGRPEVLPRLAELNDDPDPDVAAAAARFQARVSADPPPLSFRLFGNFRVCRGSWEPDDAAWERRVAQRVVRFLLTHRDLPVSEDELFEAFFPEKEMDAARRSLQVALSSARAVLDVPGVESTIETVERTYRLKLRERDSVDVDRFERAADAALTAPARERTEQLERAERLWGGEPLPEDRYSDWAIPWRERLGDRYAAVLGALVDSYLRLGDLAAATEAGRKLVELDELNEAAHRSLMLVYARAGRRGHALRQYLECRRVLVAELGIEPAAETAQLQRRILAGEPV
jgi:DNA-binding SARP family transcriptional activator